MIVGILTVFKENFVQVFHKMDLEGPCHIIIESWENLVAKPTFMTYVDEVSPTLIHYLDAGRRPATF